MTVKFTSKRCYGTCYTKRKLIAHQIQVQGKKILAWPHLPRPKIYNIIDTVFN